MTVLRPPSWLARRRAAARLALWFERLWPALWPAFGVLGVYAGAALFDLPASLPPWPRLLLLLLVVLGAAWLFWRGLRFLAVPTASAVDRRLEAATGLAHRPLAALADRPAQGATEVDASALWSAHLARLSAQVKQLRVGVPRPGMAVRDPMALRYALVVVLAAGLAAAGSDAPDRVLRAFTPIVPSGPAAPAAQLRAWVTPPSYTGLAPLFLRPETQAVSVPQGSHLTVSLTGGSGEPSLSLDNKTEPFRALDPTSWQADRDLTASGPLEIRRRGAGIAAWKLTIIPDQPPTAAFTEAPGADAAESGPGLQTRLPWRAEDDYGVVGLEAQLRLRDRPDAPPLIVRIPLPGGTPKSAHGVLTQDLTPHPWAGLDVVAQLVARDGAGQTGTSADATFILPEREFKNPLARTILVIRRQLSLKPETRDTAKDDLEALSEAPEAFGGATSVFLNLRTIAALLALGHEPATVDEAQKRMWELALALEEGAAERTAKALEAARQALEKALEAEKEAKGAEANQDQSAEKAELDRKMQALQEAIQRHLEALAEQAKRDGSEMPYDPDAQHLNSRDLDRKAEEMRKAAREGRMDEARQRMAELEKMLDELKAARPEHGQSKNAEKREQGKQQMGALRDMVQREGGLLDHAQSRTEPSPDLRRPSPPQPSDANQQDSDTRQQRALRRALGELMQRFGDLTGQVPKSLGEADTAMRDAGKALADGRDQAAGAAQQRAIEALQKGGRGMSQQVAKKFGVSKQPGDGDEGQNGNDEASNGEESSPGDGQGQHPSDGTGKGKRRDTRRDPLGRLTQQGTSGTDEAGDVHVPDQMEQARTREIQDELRRRGADRRRPPPELDYIDRLLKPF